MCCDSVVDRDISILLHSVDAGFEPCRKSYGEYIRQFREGMVGQLEPHISNINELPSNGVVSNIDLRFLS